MPDGNEYLLEESAALVSGAADSRFDMRLLGGLAVRTRSLTSRQHPWARECSDCDFFARAKAAVVEDLFASRGWEADKEFNLYNGEFRLSFRSPQGGKKADVFLNAFRMCHQIPLASRVSVDELTLPLSELLLTKLQVVHANDKDFRDVACLLIDHEVGDRDGATINRNAFASACSGDWGLWRTITGNLDKFLAWLPSSGASSDAQDSARERVSLLTDSLNAAPKSLAWKARALIGERAVWYELPEEVER
jgi:hypothetical protein